MTTIFVDRDFCTRCGICSVVCPIAIIRPPDENTVPAIPENKAGMCLNCGHCEVSCPTGALLLNYLADEKLSLPSGFGSVDPRDLSLYMRKRRSVRHFTSQAVGKETISDVLEIARYAPSGGNGQPVEWLVIYNPGDVRTIAGLTIDWMKTLLNSDHPMSGYVQGLINGWVKGFDGICRGAPHLLISHIPKDNPIAPVDGIIAMTNVDIAAPAFGIGTCWAGFVAAASREYPPLARFLDLPEGRIVSYALMFGYPQYKIHGIPRRKPLQVTWRE
jgi:nitroreductase/NAD-dependent dihydropyrimidine dehydrogenase PreA subunit